MAAEQSNEETNSLHPIGDENVRLVRGFAVAVRSPDEALAVGGKHREGVEIGMMGELADVAAIRVHCKNVEVAVARGREDNFLAIAADGRFSVVTAGRICQAV